MSPEGPLALEVAALEEVGQLELVVTEVRELGAADVARSGRSGRGLGAAVGTRSLGSGEHLQHIEQSKERRISNTPVNENNDLSISLFF